MGTPGRARLAEVARRGARLAFAGLIVLSPFRARIELVARPSPPVYADYTDVLLFWSDIALIATLALWLVSVVARPRRVSPGPPFLAWPVAGLLAFAALGVPFAVDPALAADNALRLVALACLALYVVNEIDRLERLVAPVAAMIVVQAIVAIGQVVGQQSLGLSALGEHVLSPILGVSVVTSAEGVRLLRGYGLTDHPNILGGLLAFGLLIVGAGATRPSRRPILAVVLGLGTVALLLTFSRAALLALGAGAAVAALMLVRRRDRPAARGWLAPAFGGALLCALFVAPYLPWFAARVDASGTIATEARSIDERASLTAAAGQILVGHPLLGVGVGTLPVAMRAADPAFAFAFQPAPLVLLDVAAETGVGGALCYLALLISPWWAVARDRARWTRELAAASSVLAAVTVVGLFDYYTWTYSAGRIWAWLALGLWARAYLDRSGRAADA